MIRWQATPASASSVGGIPTQPKRRGGKRLRGLGGAGRLDDLVVCSRTQLRVLDRRQVRQLGPAELQLRVNWIYTRPALQRWPTVGAERDNFPDQSAGPPVLPRHG